MAGMLVVLALLAAVVLGVVVALVVAPAAGIALGVLLLLAGIVAQRADDGPRRAIGITLLLALLAGGSYGAVVVIDVVEAVTTTAGTPEPADPSVLGAAEDKLATLDDAQAFRLELTEPELQAVVQDGIAANPDLPLRRVDLDLRGPTQDMAFTATFKSGGVAANGTATITARDGVVAVDLGPLRFGSVEVPGVARGAVESLLGAVTDLNAALAAQQASVQSIEIGQDTLIVVGTRSGTPLTGGELLGSIRDQAAAGADAVVAPPEVLGPGTVDGPTAPGDPVVLALGDSLAAGVGVTNPRDGYVSRFHRAVAERDGVPYGLANLGVVGETSGTLLLGGQLAAAEQELAGRPAAYVTLDIGANDLLGHLESPDCGADLTSAACQDRVERTLVAYRANLGAVLDRLGAAAGDAPIVLLQTYNPFSLGLGESEQERESSAIVARLNAVAAEVAAARGVLVADGFTPMRGTTAATTHMLDPVPDIHPNAAGHDVLATALFQALPG